MRISYQSTSVIACLAVSFIATLAGAAENFIIDADGNLSRGASSSTKRNGLLIQGIATDKFETSMKLANSQSLAIENDVGNFQDSIDDIENGLKIPKDIKFLAGDLDDTFRTVESGLSVIGVIPIAKTPTKLLKKAIDKSRPALHKAESKAGKIDKRLKSSKEKVAKLEKKVEDFLRKVRDLREGNTRFLNRILDLKDKIHNNPGSGSETLEKKVDDIAESATPHVDQFNQLLGQSRDMLKNTINDSRYLRDALGSLSTVREGINDIRDILGPVKKPLRELQRALDREFCAGWGWFKFCISASDVFDAVDAVVDLLLGPVLSLLEPLFEAIGLPTQLPDIPGLDMLDKVEEHVEAFEATMQGTIDNLADSVNKMLEYDGVLTEYKNQLSALESEFSGGGCVDIYPETCAIYFKTITLTPGISFCWRIPGLTEICPKSCGAC